MPDATMQNTTATLPFNEVVPGAVLESTKNGLVVAPEKLLDLATYLRDQQGYDYLSMVTSVDWPQYFEVVYYLYRVGLRLLTRRHGETGTRRRISRPPCIPRQASPRPPKHWCSKCG